MAVSVILPTYNRANLIGDAIQSVLDQTYTGFELIVVDDGSTDDTANLVQSFNDNRIRYIYQPNGGVSNARNHGVRQAKHDLITFLDSDDAYLPHKLQKQVDYFQTHPDTVFLYSSYLFMDADLNLIETRHLHIQGRAFRSLLRRCEIPTPTVMMKRCVFESVGGFDEGLTLLEDVDLWWRIAARHPIALVGEPLVQVRWHPSNTVRDPRRLEHAYFHALSKHHLSGLLRRQIHAHTWFKSGNWYLSAATPDRHQALRCLLLGMRLWPLDRTGGLLLARLIYRTIRRRT